MFYLELFTLTAKHRSVSVMFCIKYPEGLLSKKLKVTKKTRFSKTSIGDGFLKNTVKPPI